jgi:hypothetical protein
VRLDDSGNVVQVGGVRYTVKDGIVYDAPRLLRMWRGWWRTRSARSDDDGGGT